MNLTSKISNLTSNIEHLISKILRTRRRKILSVTLAVLITLSSLRLFLFLNPKEVKAATLSLSTTATTVQIGVPNRYRAIIYTGDVWNVLELFDRAENDSSPDEVIELAGLYVIDENGTYQSGYDASRKTTILESTNTRVKVRMEGCLDTSTGGECLKDVDDGDDDELQATEEFTFTTEGVFINRKVDFKDGLELDNTTYTDKVVTYIPLYNSGGSNYHSDTIYYGDGETESSSSTSETISGSTDAYVVLQGVGSYQDIIFAETENNGDKLLSNSTAGFEWHSDGSSDYVSFNDQDTQTLIGQGDSQFFIQFHAQNELNTEVEREALFNDLTNPDILSYTTGGEWGDVSGAQAGGAPSGASPGLNFDGSADFVQIPYNAIYKPTDEITIEGWVRADDFDANLNITGEGSWDRMRLFLDSGDNPSIILNFDTAGAQQAVWSTTLTADTWYHLAGVYDGSNLIIYVNGIERDTVSVGSDTINQTTADLYIGRYSSEYLDGSVDEVRIWNDARTITEIKDNMYKQIDPTSANLVGYWRLNENTGSTAHDETTNNNDGTITGATWASGYVPDGYNEAEGAYTSDMVTSDVEVDIDAGPNVSTLINDATVSAGDATFTVDSTSGFPSSGIAYIEGDKFSYTGTTGTTFTGIPSSGELSIIGHADNSVVSLSQRHTPLYKLRNYRKNDVPQNVTLEQDTLTLGSEYNAAIKPFSTSYFAQDLLWHSTMESEATCDTPDVGSGNCTLAGNTAFSSGKYGNGVSFDADGDYLYFPSSSNFDKAKGAIEFWYQPNYDHDDSTTHWLISSWTDASNFFYLYKYSSNNLYFEIRANGTTYSEYVTSANYNWLANDWVHLRIEWDDSDLTPFTNQQKIFINGVEPTHTDSTGDYDSSVFTMSTNFTISASNANEAANGIIDEFRIYDFNGSGDRAELAKLSVGGDVSDADEYLYDATNDYTFDFNDDDASNRGEYVWLGSDSPYGGVNIDLATDGVGSSENFDWEYWNGTAWTALTVTEQDIGSSSFTGDGNFYFTPPGDWFPYSVNGSTDLYYIRGHLEGGSYSTDPIESRIQTDILLLHYQDNIDDENQSLIIPAITSGPNPPVVYWNLDEGYGTTANDASGHGNAGTISGATWQTEDLCYSQKCLYFDGSNDEVTRVDDPEFDIDEAGSFTISAWIRHPDIATNPDVIAAKFESTGGDGGYRLQMESDGDISFGIDDENTSFPEDTVTSTSADYDDNQWHHISAVKDANDNLYLYIDGNLIDTDATISATDSLDNNDDFYLGIDGDGSSNAWAGFIDEFKFYRYARSADEIKADLVKGASVRGAQTSYGIRDYSYLSDGLVGYWPMDDAGVDTEGETSTDSSGNGNDGTLYGDDGTGDNGTGMDCTASGKFGTGCDFDGTDDYVDAPNIVLNNRSFSIEGWIKADNLSSDRTWLGQHHAYGTGESLHLRLYTDGSLRFGFYFDDLDTSAGVISANNWYHVAYTFDNSSSPKVRKIYVNGEEKASDNPTNAYQGSSGSNYIGRWIGGQYWLGAIDEVRIYNRAFSPAEVSDLYNWAPGPVGYWPMDEGSGTSTTYDHSGNGLNASINGIPETAWVNGKFGKTIDFDGNDYDWLQVDDTALLDITGPMTVSAWIKPESSTGYRVIASKFNYGDTNRSWRFYLDHATGYISFEVSSDGSGTTATTGTTSLSMNNWYYVTSKYDGSNVYVYVDGTEEDSTAHSTGIFSGSADFAIGANFDNANVTNRFDGLIDDVRLYNYPRTPSQIIEDMNAEHPVGGSPIGSPLHYYTLDELYGTTTNDSGFSAVNGTFDGVNPPTWTTSGKFGGAIDCELDNSEAVDLGNIVSEETQLSVTAWIKPETIIADGGIVGEGSAFRLYTRSDGDLSLFIRGNPSDGSTTLTTTSTPLSAGNWYHVAGVWNGDNATWDIYVNAQVQTDDGTANNRTALDGVDSDNATICQEYNGFGPFDGIVDEVKIYNVALTADQIKIDMNQGKAAVWGATGTDSSGTASNAAIDAYCPPGQGSACTAPVGEWKFDEKTGTTANDTSGNGNTGTLTNGPTWNHAGECQRGACLDFDGSNDYINVDTTVGGDFDIDLISISVWFNPQELSTSTTQRIFQRHAARWGMHLHDTTSTLRFYVDTTDDGGSWVDLSATISNTNQWYHAEGVYDGSNMYLYINGILIDSDPQSGLVDDGSRTYVSIGSGDQTPSELFKGTIDEIKIYDYARSPAQVAWDYNRGGPVGYWALDECTGTTANDASGNSNNGTITPGDSSGDNDSAGTCNSGATAPTDEMWDEGTTGKRNASLDFDGTNDRISVTHTDLLNANNAISVSLWMKAPDNGTNYKGLVAKNTSSEWDSGEGWAINFPGSGQLQLAVGNGTIMKYAVSTNEYDDNAWHHVTGTWSGGLIKFYIDGKEVNYSLQESVTTSSDSTSEMRIGDYAYLSNDRLFTGQLDEVKIFNYALTQQQIRDNYNAGAAVRYGPDTGSP